MTVRGAQPALFPALVSEREFTTAIIQQAHWRGWLCAHFYPLRRADGTWRTPVQADGAGFPDLVLARGGRVVVAELKTEKGRLAPLQERWGAELAGGVEYYVWRPSQQDEISRVLA